MKKTGIILPVIALYLILFSCTSAVDDAKDTVDGLECASLIQEIDAKYNRDDRPCSEIRSDVDQILKTCEKFLDDEQKQQLAFYKNNCSAEN